MSTSEPVDLDRDDDVRMSDVLAAMSAALDLVEGQPDGHAARSCLLGMRIAEELGLDAAARESLFYALLLKDLGCSSNAAKVCYLFGADEHEVKRDFKTTDWTKLLDTARYVARNVAPGGRWTDRLRHFLRAAVSGQRGARELVQIRCERGSSIARGLGLPEAACEAILNLDEHWDGAGHPAGLHGTEIPLLARILGLAQTVEVFLDRHGVEAALTIARRRAGSWFDPELVRVLLSLESDRGFWASLRLGDPRTLVGTHEPEDRIRLAGEESLDRVCAAFAEVIDAKSPWTACHSQGVSDLAVGAAEAMGLPHADVRRLRRAGLLHDVGKLGVSSRILDKAGRLTDEELAEMRRHPAYSLTILGRVRAFAEFADLAASHHERLDGAGYHRGLVASELSTPARILVVADMYEALAAKRPYRRDLEPGEVHDILRKGLGTAICPEAYEALTGFLDASGFVPHTLAA